MTPERTAIKLLKKFKELLDVIEKLSKAVKGHNEILLSLNKQMASHEAALHGLELIIHELRSRQQKTSA